MLTRMQVNDIFDIYGWPSSHAGRELAELGLASIQGEGIRKRYVLTEEGQELLIAWDEGRRIKDRAAEVLARVILANHDLRGTVVQVQGIEYRTLGEVAAMVLGKAVRGIDLSTILTHLRKQDRGCEKR